MGVQCVLADDRQAVFTLAEMAQKPSKANTHEHSALHQESKRLAANVDGPAAILIDGNVVFSQKRGALP